MNILYIQINKNNENYIIFDSGKAHKSFCIKCSNKYCMYFNKSTIDANNLSGFPADKNNNICISNAIYTNDAGVVVINDKDCIRCGACMTRCPFGAIKFKNNVMYVDCEKTNIDKKYFETIQQASGGSICRNLKKTGTHLYENDDLIDDIFTRRIPRIREKAGDNFPNLLTRNLLLAGGQHASISRKGNNFMRMDIILFEKIIKYGVVETEFGQESVLDAPRDVLDAVAVLASRYNWNKDVLQTIIVSDILPNKRSEYWNIIKDIDDVLGIKIKTITIFALYLLIWNNIKFESIDLNLFYKNTDIVSYRKEVLEKIINRKLELSETPRSQIDLVK